MASEGFQKRFLQGLKVRVQVKNFRKKVYVLARV